LKSKQEEENQTQMNGDVVSVKQYPLRLLGNQRKEVNIIRSNHNPSRSITNNLGGEGGLFVKRQTKWKYDRRNMALGDEGLLLWSC
jgi:hypothetical protein